MSLDIETLCENLIGGPRSINLSLRNRGKEEVEFHRIRRLKPGRWRFMGHDIVRDHRGFWQTNPRRLTDKRVTRCRTDTKYGMEWELYYEYQALCIEVIRIQTGEE